MFTWAELCKAGLRYRRVSSKFEFRYESLKSKLATLKLATLKGIEKIVRENAFDEKKKRPGFKFNSGLALIGLRTSGP